MKGKNSVNNTAKKPFGDLFSTVTPPLSVSACATEQH